MYTNDALPEKISVANLMQSMENSSIPIFVEVGHKLREYIFQRELTDKDYVPTLEHAKLICDSAYKSATVNAAGNAPGSNGIGGIGSAGSNGSHQRNGKGTMQGQKAKVSLDDPSAMAHLARGRSGKPFCYRCQKEGHMSHECMES